MGSLRLKKASPVYEAMWGLLDPSLPLAVKEGLLEGKLSYQAVSHGRLAAAHAVLSASTTGGGPSSTVTA